MNENKIKLLIVDDEAEFRASVRKALSRRGYDILEAANGRDAVNLVEKDPPAIVLLDRKMPGMDGIATLRQLRTRHPDLPVIILTGHGDYETAVAAVHLRIAEFIQKPVDMDHLDSHIRAVLARGSGAQLKERGIRDLMVPADRYEKLYIDQPVAELAGKLWNSFFEAGTDHPKKDRVRSVLVYDRKENFVGTVRFVDLLKLVLPPYIEDNPYSSFFTGMFLAQCKVIGNRNIREIMGDPASVDIGAPLMEAVHLLVKHRLINLPVMENNRLAGILRERDVISAIAHNMGILGQSGPDIKEQAE